jgi:hypothetical protein
VLAHSTLKLEADSLQDLDRGGVEVKGVGGQALQGQGVEGMGHDCADRRGGEALAAMVSAEPVAELAVVGRPGQQIVDAHAAHQDPRRIADGAAHFDAHAFGERQSVADPPGGRLRCVRLRDGRDEGGHLAIRQQPHEVARVLGADTGQSVPIAQGCLERHGSKPPSVGEGWPLKTEAGQQAGGAGPDAGALVRTGGLFQLGSELDLQGGRLASITAGSNRSGCQPCRRVLGNSRQRTSD